ADTITQAGINNGNNIVAYGPFADYSPVIYTTYGAYHGENFQWVASTHANDSGNVSPFRRATITGPDSRSWVPKDALSHWSDGTSNQLIFGEKHIPKGAQLGGGAAFRYDQSFLAATNSGGRDWAIGRMVSENRPLAQASEKTNPQYYFGSWHTGTVNFLIGDGAVRSISVTTPGLLLGQLSNPKDGKAASLP
ncbi:MAG: DUF1559 domain-containing protein, partial [Thermoguttaceae bacterium]